MQVIILRIPAAASKNEIRTLVGEILGKRTHLPFTARPKITRCKVLSIKAKGGDTDHHAVITIDPDKAAKWLIKHFKRQKVHKKMVSAREYFVRGSSAKQFDTDSDRRREGLVIDVVGTPKISVVAIPGFVKEYH